MRIAELDAKTGSNGSARARHARRAVSAAANGAPVWTQIENLLAQRIATGALAPGVRLPPANALAIDFGVNRHTMRQALAGLAARGLVRIVHGVGAFVCEFSLDYVLGKRTRLNENLSAVGIRGRHRMIESSTIAASQTIATKLAMPPGGTVLRIDTVAEARGLPISTAEHYFPMPRFEGLDGAFARTGSITRALKQFDVVDYLRRENLITARLPDGSVAQRLQQSAMRPVLYVESVNVDTAGAAIEFGRAWFAGDLVQLVVEPGR